MKKYRIEVNAIRTTYEGNSEEEALEAYATDAGYSSYADLAEQHGDIDSIEETTKDKVKKK